MRISNLVFCGLTYFVSTFSLAQNNWSVASFPDESGFQQRIAGMLTRLAEQPFGVVSKSKSVCPDTGLSVYTYALEGETIYSPFTGTAYTQGNTGYFGAKERDPSGHIIRFGGDALKKELPPATAAMLLYAENLPLKGFLSIRGNLNQQYHFAAKNWARFYPLLAEAMGEEWRQHFQYAVGNYQELGRPSDGYRVYEPLSVPHNLIGERGKLLGGNNKDGGTENHKIMWRSAALVYAQHFPEASKISGYNRGEAKKILQAYFEDFLETILTKGNGEYDSQIYYPHSIESLLNLYDFSDDKEIKATAKALLDYFLATYALKVYDGAIAGAQKRGSYDINSQGEMFHHLHAWFGNPNLHDADFISSLHQITSNYRPNKLIVDLYHKNVGLPFEVEIARPDYHSTTSNIFHEYFYASKSFGMGSVYMNQIDNPNQQVVWSLVVKGMQGPLTFGGSQPFHKAPGGHSPYTQTLQKEGVIIVASAPTCEDLDEGLNPNGDRLHWANADLVDLDTPIDGTGYLDEFFEKATYQAATWLFIPRAVDAVKELDGKIFISTTRGYITVAPFNSDYYWIKKPSKDKLTSKGIQALLEKFDILVVPGKFSGYVLEINEATSFKDFDDYIGKATTQKLKVTSELKSITFTSLSGITLDFVYMSDQLKGKGRINGAELNFEEWADGGVYKSPVLSVKNGTMNLTNKESGYLMHVKNRKVHYLKTKTP
jgi:hypothetical protein